MSKVYVIRQLPAELGRYPLSGEFKPEELTGPYADLVEVKLDSHSPPSVLRNRDFIRYG